MEIVYFYDSALLHSIWKYILQKFALLCQKKAWYTLSFFFITVTYIDHKVDHLSYFLFSFQQLQTCLCILLPLFLPPSYLPSTLVKLPHPLQFLVTEFYCVASSIGAVWVITGLGVSIEAGGLTIGDTAKEPILLSLNVFLRNTRAQLWSRSPFDVDSWASSVCSHPWATVTSIPLWHFSSFSSEFQCDHHTAIPFSLSSVHGTYQIIFIFCPLTFSGYLV